MSRVPLAIVALLVAACGAGPVVPAPTAPPAAPPAAPSAVPSDAPSAPPSDAPSVAPSAALDGIPPLRVGSLPAGRYATTGFKPRLELTMDSDWEMLFLDDADEVAFERRTPLAFFNIGRVSQVIDPSSYQTVDVPDDLATWLSGHPALEVKRDEAATVAGLAGRMIEANVKAAGDTDMFGYPTGNMRVILGDRVRFYVLPLDGPDLALTVGSGIETFDDAMATVEPIIESLEIGSPD